MSARALHNAIVGGDVAEVARLLDGDGTVEDLRAGWTPLMRAAGSGHRAIVALLLERGADVARTAPNGLTPFLVACLAGKHDVAELLAQHGADVHARVPSGENGVWFAADAGCTSIVRWLLGHGVDPDAVAGAVGSTAAMLAAQRGDLPMLEALVEAGADLSIRMPGGGDALCCAASAGQESIVAWLLDRVSPAPGPNGMSPLHVACDQGHVSIVERLLAAGADPNAIGPDGQTATFRAARGPEAMLVAMIAHGGDPHRRPPSGDTPLLRAIVCAQPEIVERLLALGEDPAEARPDGATPLLAAAENGSVPLVRRCIALGVPVDPPHPQGLTPLLGAAAAGHAEVVRVLLEAGADRSRTLPDGRTALDLARFGRHRDVARALGADPDAWGRAPDALLERLAAEDLPTVRGAVGDTHRFVAAEGASDRRLARALVAAAARLQDILDHTRLNRPPILRPWAVDPEALQILVECVVDELGASLDREDTVAAWHLAQHLSEAVTHVETIRDPATRQVRHVDLTGALGPLAGAFLPVLGRVEPLVADRTAALLLGALHGLLLSVPAEEAVVKVVARQTLAVAGHDPLGTGLPARLDVSTQLGASGIAPLVRLVADALGRADPAKVAAYGPYADPAYRLAEQGCKQLLPYREEADAVGPALVEAVPPDRMGLLALAVRRDAGTNPFVARAFDGEPVIRRVVEAALARATGDALGDFELLAARLGLGGRSLPFPEALPVDVDGAMRLAEAFGVDLGLEPPLDPGDLPDRSAFDALPDELRALLRRANGLARPPIAPFGDAEATVALRELAEQHRSEVNDAYVCPYDHDLRSFGAIAESPTPDALIALGTSTGGDVYFLDPRARTPEGTLPVLRYDHAIAFHVVVAAVSLGAWIAEVVATDLAERAAAAHLLEGVRRKASRLDRM